MALEDIPPHYLIMHQFLYQAERDLKGDSESGIATYTGKTRNLANKLRELGWRRADYNRETIDADGNPVIKKQINRDSFWYRPEHWVKDEEMFPPIEAKTPQAKEFMHKIRRGRRTMFPQDAKEVIMDGLIQYMSGGKVSQWYGGAGGHERMKNRAGRLDRPTPVALDLPDDIDQWMLIPGAAFMANVKKMDPEGVEPAERGMAKLGWERAMPGNREKEVWYNPKHWEPAIGGELGLLPLTDEAEEYQSRLPPAAPTPSRRFLPDISLLPDIETVVKIAMDVGKTSTPQRTTGQKGPGKKEPGQVFRSSAVSGEKEWMADPSLDDIDAATAGKPRPKAELPGRAGSSARSAPSLGHQARAHNLKVGKDTSSIDDEDEDDDEDDDEEDVVLPNKRMSAAELDALAAKRWEKEREKMGLKKKPAAEKKPEPDEELDDMIFADD